MLETTEINIIQFLDGRRGRLVSHDFGMPVCSKAAAMPDLGAGGGTGAPAEGEGAEGVDISTVCGGNVGALTISTTLTTERPAGERGRE